MEPQTRALTSRGRRLGLTTAGRRDMFQPKLEFFGTDHSVRQRGNAGNARQSERWERDFILSE
jgi:hypothetical protein